MTRAVSEDSVREQDVPHLTEAVRDYVSRLVEDPDRVEDVTQEAVLRVWEARRRVDRGVAVAYGIATARNLLADERRRGEVHARHVHRLVDVGLGDSPEEEALRREEQAAAGAALDALPDRDRALLDDRYSGAPGSSAVPGSRLAAARSRARVGYLLALRRIDLPTSRCRPVLEALSSGDRRRQERVGAARHLLACRVCAECAPALLSRSRAMFGLLPVPALFLDRLPVPGAPPQPAPAAADVPVGSAPGGGPAGSGSAGGESGGGGSAGTSGTVGARGRSARARTGQAAAAGVAALAVMTAAVLAVLGSDSRPADRAAVRPAALDAPASTRAQVPGAGAASTAAPPATRPPATRPAAATPTGAAPAGGDGLLTQPPGTVLAGDLPLLRPGRVGRPADAIGRVATARSVRVLSVPTDEGFWVGTDTAHQLWVQLKTAQESPLAVRPGDVLTFPARVEEAQPGQAPVTLLEPGEGRAALRDQGAFLSTRVADVQRG